MIKNIHFLYTVVLIVFTALIAGTLVSCAPINQLVDEDSPQILNSEIDPITPHAQAQRSNLSNPQCPAIDNDPSYRLGVDDEIKILVYNEQNLSGQFTIPNTGVLNLPLIGQIMLASCTLQQAETILKQKYSDGYLVSPSISVSVVGYRPFYVIGEVQRPGQYDYVVDMNALQAVAIAGGFTYRANRKSAKILSKRESNDPIYQPIKIEDKIRPGDVIMIQERLF